MKTIIIELTRLFGDDSKRFQATTRQMEFIQGLMKKAGLSDLFKKHFTKKGKTVNYHITQASASTLIDALKKNKTVVFTGYEAPKEMKEQKIKTIYKPLPAPDEIQKITMEKLNEIEKKYTNNI
jgi:hypothetical protein